ncbi:hypothetical protein ACQEVB_19990 [Pseudonocardia sp. CA-107938]
MALGADMWFEAFAMPWPMETVPQVLTVPKTAWVRRADRAQR